MMRQGHESAAAPVAVGTVWSSVTIGLPVVVSAVMGVLVWLSCMLPDLDHPAKKTLRSQIVRWVAWHVWAATRTSKDKVKTRGDTHRDFTHTLEGCLLFGAGATLIPASLLLVHSDIVRMITDYSVWFGLAVFLGCLSHIAADSMTPSGVPVSMVMNRLLRCGTWQRWCLGWRWRPVLSGLTIPVISVIRITTTGPRASCEHRGFFRTDSAGEKLIARPVLYAVSVLLIVLATGIARPVFGLVTGLVSRAAADPWGLGVPLLVLIAVSWLVATSRTRRRRAGRRPRARK